MIGGVVQTHLIRNWEWYAIFGLGYYTKEHGWGLARWTAQNVVRPIAVGVGTATLNVLRTPVAASVYVPLAVGAGASYAIAGKEGVEDYADYIEDVFTGDLSALGEKAEVVKKQLPVMKEQLIDLFTGPLNVWTYIDD